jgi:REP element-mobilizing transposase RayT
MPYWQLYYHVVWTTRKRQPWLTPDVETIVYRIIRAKINKLEGVTFALNGTLDHTHAVVAIPPKIAVASFIGQIKGVASALFNKDHPREVPFAWQAEYGVFSFDKKRLPNYVAYVDRQKEHHAANRLIPILERFEGEWSRIEDVAGFYVVDDDAWFAMMQSL